MVHDVTAKPVNTLDSGCIGYKFLCSCGREGSGWHNTEAKAIEAGQAHIITRSER